MNLFDMANRKDSVLTLSPHVSQAKSKEKNGDTWRSLRVASDQSPQMRIDGVPRWYPLSTKPETVGWFVRTSSGSGSLVIQLADDRSTISAREIEIDERERPVPIPWPMTAETLPDNTVLTLHFKLKARQTADLMINKSLDRAELINLARGRGIEVGPGPKPQILNGPGVSVQYVEEMSAGEWRDHYDKGGKYGSENADWSNYIVGKASSLPCDDDSLDFIFSSHVFEHLANPIGHLRHWGAKLKSGGRILAVIPDLAGTKDFRHRPCNLDEMIQEFDADLWEPTLKHYERWASTRTEWAGRAEEAMNEKRSIHVHFYSRENMAALLQYAVDALPFSGFHIRHTPNHRDFHWVLIKR